MINTTEEDVFQPQSATLFREVGSEQRNEKRTQKVRVLFSFQSHPANQGTKAFSVGMSVEIPKFTAPNPAVVCKRYHVPVDGRHTAMSVFPSPS